MTVKGKSKSLTIKFGTSILKIKESGKSVEMTLRGFADEKKPLVSSSSIFIDFIHQAVIAANPIALHGV